MDNNPSSVGIRPPILLFAEKKWKQESNEVKLRFFVVVISFSVDDKNDVTRRFKRKKRYVPLDGTTRVGDEGREQERTNHIVFYAGGQYAAQIFVTVKNKDK